MDARKIGLQEAKAPRRVRNGEALQVSKVAWSGGLMLDAGSGVWNEQPLVMILCLRSFLSSADSRFVPRINQLGGNRPRARSLC